MPDSESLKGKTPTQFCYFVINIASVILFSIGIALLIQSKKYCNSQYT